MKKFFIVISSLAFGISALLMSVKSNFIQVKAATHSDLAGVLSGYIDDNGNYTKKSKIYLNNAAVSEAAAYFHASSVSLERTTYYDDDFNSGGALLMGDYDGTFAHINSGYATADSKLYHYRGTSVAALGDNLFTERNSDYSINGKTCNQFFDVLSGLSAQVAAGSASDWTYEDGVYTHAVPAHMTLDENGNYTDILLKKFQYFGAPMLLQSAGDEANHYLTFTSIKVTTNYGYLSIRLYISSVDSGKVTTPVENGEVMLSEAQVFKGLGAINIFKNGQFAEFNSIVVTDENKANYQQVLNPGDAVVIKHGLTELKLGDSDYVQYTAVTYGVHTFYVNKDYKVYTNSPEFYGKLNGNNIIINNQGGSYPDSETEFLVDLAVGDVLEVYYQGTKIHFYHYDGANIDDGDSYTATAAGRHRMYVNPSSGIWTKKPKDLYVRGTAVASGWDDVSIDNQLRENDGNYAAIYSISLLVGEFKIASANWGEEYDSDNMSAHSNFEQGEGTNIKCKVAGTYNIYINNSKTIYFELVP